MSSEHEKWMKIALSLAKRGLGNVAPNPAVGCLLVKGDVIVGRGWTQPGGRPHAEACALEMAGDAAKGATAYVTLEPCAHYGQTPPCAEALIRAGVSSVYIAVMDSDERVGGRGINMLRKAGIAVVTGILEADARRVNAGFFDKVEKGRPFFTLKSATTLDGRIATASGDSKWITGPKARRYGHMERARHDAILVGINTVLADDPSLDCRIEGLTERSPQPIVLDSALRTPLDSRLIKNAGVRPPLLVCDNNSLNSKRAAALVEAGAQILTVTSTRNIADVACCLAARGITRVLVEGGGQVLASLLTAGICDRYLAFIAGKVIGSDGTASVASLGLAELGDAPHLTLKSIRKVGADLLATYVNAE